MTKRSAGAPGALMLLAVSATATAQNTSAPPPPPPSTQRVAAPADDLQVSPKNGQSPEQLWNDRYACHTWSKSQSGFDPTRPAAGVAPDESVSAGEQYRRAMRACLEARGYSVSNGAPAPPPAAAPAAPLRQPSHEDYSAQVVGLRYHPLSVQLNFGYTLTEGALKPALNDGGTVGLGLAWFPSSALPLGLRIDASYSSFPETLRSLAAASAATGTNVAFGDQYLYGADADLQLDLAHGASRVKMYLFGGAGWYRQQTIFRQVLIEKGVVCFFDCFLGNIAVASDVERSTSPWVKSWNAGLGIELALHDPARFFVEARYLRIAPYSSDQVFIPITMGLRF